MRRRAAPTPIWPADVLVMDLETTIDQAQRLTFGCAVHLEWTLERGLIALTEWLIYDDDLPCSNPEGFRTLQRFVAEHQAQGGPAGDPQIQLTSRADFVAGPFWDLAFRAQALVVGFNLPFDLTRLAVGWGIARRLKQREQRARRHGRDIFAGGFSLTLWPRPPGSRRDRPDNRNRPHLRLKPIDSKRTLMGFAGVEWPRKKRGPSGRFTGRFLDLKTLTFGLTDAVHSLESAAKALGLGEQKHQIKRHGVISEPYVEYCRQDVRVTVALLVRLREEFDRHPIELAPDQVRSPASIAKAYLRAMGITSPAQQFSGFPPIRLGQAMSAYFGGRSEVRIRHTIVPVIYVDFLSMYPTVNALFGLQELLCAEQLQVEDATAEVRELLAGITPDRCFAPDLWPRLRGFALVRPKRDILPLRGAYDEARDGTTIGLNHVSADEPLWWTLFDVVSSVHLTGKAPEVLEAWRVVPIGQQTTLQPVALRKECRIDPQCDPIFQQWVEERQRSKARARSEPTAEGLQQFLKVLANSGSYGIFAEANRVELPRGGRELVTVYGAGAPFTCRTHAPEELGEYCFGVLAALTTGAARLMLALLERCITDLGGSYVFCDTDSMAIVATEDGSFVPCFHGPERLRPGVPAVRALSRADVDHIVHRFAGLSPYDPSLIPSILKVEDVNCVSGEPRQLWAYAISAKRYVLFNRLRNGWLKLRQPSEHGLGHLMNPIAPGEEEEEQECGCTENESWPRWIGDVWRYVVAQALGRKASRPHWFDRPAFVRIGITRPDQLQAFDAFNGGRSYADGIKPMNFGLTVRPVRMFLPAEFRHRFQLLAPFTRDTSQVLKMVEKFSGQLHPIRTGLEALGDGIRIRTVGEEVDLFRWHPETKSADARGRPCGPRTRGLLRRRELRVDGVVYTGKESNRYEEVELGLISDLEEVRTVYRPPGQDSWRRAAVPLLARVPIATVAGAAGVSTRMGKFYRSGRKRPGPEATRRLMPLLRVEARRMLRRRKAAPQHRVAAERFLEAFPGLMDR